MHGREDSTHGRTEPSAGTQPFPSVPSGENATLHLGPDARPVALPERLPVGTVVGRYTLQESLGEGGMGVVYAALDPQLQRRVAIKLLRVASAGPEGDVGPERLLREAQAVAQFTHPNIITIHDVGTFQGGIFLALELVEGSTLRAWLKGQHPWRRVLQTFLAAGEGLAAAHRAGLVHRDFKPDNVLIGRDGRVRVTDFGLVRKLGEAAGASPTGVPSAALDLPSGDTAPLTRVGLVIGTPGYMAPEQYRGAAADARTDQFSFCVSLHEGLYCRKPFPGKSEVARLVALERGEVLPAERGTQVPAWVRAIVLRGLQADPAARFPSMDALLEALRKDPAVRRRRLLGIGASLLVLGALGLTSREAFHRRNQVCQGSEALGAGIWNPARETSLHAGFLQVQRPFAEDAWQGFQRQVSQRVRTWSQMRTEACEATRLRAEQSEETLSLRMSCLDERLEELRGLLDLYANPDGPLVEKAVGAASGLSSLRGCADLEALRAPLPLPEDPARRSEARALTNALAKVRPLESAGRYRQALDALTGLLPRIHALGYAPIEADALGLQGSASVALGNGKEAEQHLDEAILVADSGRADYVRARALIELTYARGFLQARYADAGLTARQAQATVQRLGTSQRTELEAYLAQTRASVFSLEGKLAEARAEAERAVTLRERRGPDDAETAISLSTRGNILRNQGDFAGAKRDYQRALDIWRQSLGPEHPQLSTGYANLGMIAAFVGSYDEALGNYGKAVALMSRYQPESMNYGVILNNVADTLLRVGRYEEAMQHASRALAIVGRAVGEDHPHYGAILQGRAEAKMGLHRWEDALTDCQAELAIFHKKLLPTHPNFSYAYACLARAHEGLGASKVALGFAERALQTAEAQPRQEVPGDDLAGWRFLVARLLADLHREPPRALKLAGEAQALYAANPQYARQRTEVERWLATHAAPKPL